MRLKYEFKSVDVVGDNFAVPVVEGGASDFHGVLRVNGVTSDILSLLKEDTTEDAVVDAMMKEYNAGREDIAESVHRIIGQLREAELLVE